MASCDEHKGMPPGFYLECCGKYACEPADPDVFDENSDCRCSCDDDMGRDGGGDSGEETEDDEKLKAAKTGGNALNVLKLVATVAAANAASAATVAATAAAKAVVTAAPSKEKKSQQKEKHATGAVKASSQSIPDCEHSCEETVCGVCGRDVYIDYYGIGANPCTNHANSSKFARGEHCDDCRKPVCSCIVCLTRCAAAHDASEFQRLVDRENDGSGDEDPESASEKKKTADLDLDSAADSTLSKEQYISKYKRRAAVRKVKISEMQKKSAEETRLKHELARKKKKEAAVANAVPLLPPPPPAVVIPAAAPAPVPIGQPPVTKKKRALDSKAGGDDPASKRARTVSPERQKEVDEQKASTLDLKHSPVAVDANVKTVVAAVAAAAAAMVMAAVTIAPKTATAIISETAAAVAAATLLPRVPSPPPAPPVVVAVKKNNYCADETCGKCALCKTKICEDLKCNKCPGCLHAARLAMSGFWYRDPRTDVAKFVKYSPPEDEQRMANAITRLKKSIHNLRILKRQKEEKEAMESGEEHVPSSDTEEPVDDPCFCEEVRCKTCSEDLFLDDLLTGCDSHCSHRKSADSGKPDDAWVCAECNKTRNRADVCPFCRETYCYGNPDCQCTCEKRLLYNPEMVSPAPGWVSGPLIDLTVD